MKNREDINFDMNFDPEKLGYNDSDDASWIDNYEPKPREKKPKKKERTPEPKKAPTRAPRPEPADDGGEEDYRPRKSDKREKKAKRRSDEPRELPEFVKFFLDKRTHAVAGIALLLIAAYLLVSAMSYFSTGRSDQSVVENASIQQIVDTPLEIDNVAGPVGAKVSYFMITKGWGLGSLVLIVYIGLVGLSLIRTNGKTRFWSLTLKCLLTAIGISLAAGVVEIMMHLDRAYPIGGYHGHHVNLWLIERIGMIGAICVNAIVATAVIYLYIKDIVAFAKRYIERRRRYRAEAYAESIPAETAHDNDSTGAGIDNEPAAATDEDSYEHRYGPRPPAEESDPEMMPVTADFYTDDDTAETAYDGEADDATTHTPTSGKAAEPVISEPGFQVVAGKIEKGHEGDSALYDPTAELSQYHRPTLDLLIDRGDNGNSIDRKEQDDNKLLITNTLLNYGIPIDDIKATVGPTVTLYEIVPAKGVKIAKIKNLEDDIALSLAALGIRIIAPIPGKGTIGIEVPNKDPQTVSIRSVLGSKAFQECKYQLPMAMGATISNEVYIADLAKMPHLLVAGATGQGKSVGLNTIIASLLYKKHPSELKFVLVDPKEVEFSLYEKLQNHFMAQLPDDDSAVITNMDKVERTLNSLCVEMDNRYGLLRDANVRTIIEYNQKFMERRLNPEKGHRYLPYIVLIIDEFADLMITAGKAIETPIARITAKARAVGIHLIIATQRPSTNVITGIIKANVPGRVAFRVSQSIESKIILDRTGANQLIGRGDMLFSCNGVMNRVQCAFIDTPEVEAMVKSIADQPGFEHPYFLPEPKTPDSELSVGNLTDRDPLFEDAARYLCSTGDTASTSSLQRRFSIGYNRAGKIMDQLEAAGVVGPAQGSKPRTLLIDLMQLDMMIGQ